MAGNFTQAIQLLISIHDFTLRFASITHEGIGARGGPVG
jgi:hypothetical protein